jgi:hypothetical protein
MRYNAVFGPDALERFEAVSALLASRIYEAIEGLCANPAELSRPSYFPHPLHFQLFETYLEHDGKRFLLKVFFHFGRGEETLCIDDFVLVDLP